MRYDWNGGLTEKYGRLFNFDPSQYSYDAGSDMITDPGLIIAGNNKNGTSGVSNTTLTGRQWGIAPRLGFALAAVMSCTTRLSFAAESAFTMIVVSSTPIFSPGYAAGEVSGGPFGVSQTPPFVTHQNCPYSASPYGNTSYLYNYYIPICGLAPFASGRRQAAAL